MHVKKKKHWVIDVLSSYYFDQLEQSNIEININ